MQPGPISTVYFTNLSSHVRFEGFTAVTVKNVVFWDFNGFIHYGDYNYTDYNY
jgi:hypothetical protein